MKKTMKKFRYILLLIVILGAGQLSAQSDMDLAEYYFTQGQYEQAKLYYEKIYKTNKTNRVYSNYLNTLIALGDFVEAEKMVKRKIKDDARDGIGYVNLGDLYKKFDKPGEAAKQFEEAVRKVEATRSNII